MSSHRSSRKRLAVLCLGALFIAATLLLPSVPSKAKGVHGNGGGRALRVLAPVSYKNLTLYPIVGRINNVAGTTTDYITLDEGIKNGTVIITERGGEQRIAQRPPRRGQANRVQVTLDAGDNASVNQLSLINRSGKKLILLAGEIVVGGKQDRIVEEDLIVPPVSVPISLNVFCVEHGRWSPRAQQTTSNRAPVSRANVIQNPSVQNAPRPVQDSNFSSLGAISHPKLRAAAQDKKQQGEVWKEVSANNSKLGTSNSTDTYQEVYANKEVAGTMEHYISALQREVLQPGVIGVVVARNGELVWVDAFASPSLFAKYWPKLLKSYVVDAMGDSADGKTKVPTAEQALEYIRHQHGADVVAGKPGVYRLTKTENAQYAVFKLEDISFTQPLRIHFNKMNR